ncbi:hypothetical protein [Novosphingobium sp.]|uniref:hypothetical protein n=1 Tax=Novosphingobium sp. TaxID=1874826 RepID=UPI001EC2555E|nr:hypothetical protein [Novosphingobium sp.]MBK9009429.1 hypothetical protein [Novosphingobium sp.]
MFASNTKKGRWQPAPTEKVGGEAGTSFAHDLRRTFTNVALGVCRIEKFRTDLLTGHKPRNDDVTASHYLDTSNLSWLQSEVQQVSDWIERQGRLATESEW